MFYEFTDDMKGITAEGILKSIEEGRLSLMNDVSSKVKSKYGKATFEIVTAGEKSPQGKYVLYALSKQVPVVPEYVSDGYAPDGSEVYDTAYCPVCEHEFEEGVNDWESNYCPDCGQALDWRGE